MYPDNNWYSHRQILAEYCGIKDKELLGSIQHGWVNSYNYDSFLIKRKFNFYCWNDSLSKYCKNKGFNKIIPIGAPFLYLCKLNNNLVSNKGSGTLVFPAHSNLEDYQKVNHKNLIEIIESKFEAPYKVHLYYTDFTSENILEYKKRGWEIYSSDIRSSNNFLINLLKNLSNTKTVVSTDISSVFFYAMYIKKKVFLLRKDKNDKDLNFIYRNDILKFTEDYEIKYKDLVNGQLSISEQKKLASIELGENYILEPKKLKKLLGFGNPLKDFASKVLSKIIQIKQGKSLKDGYL